MGIRMGLGRTRPGQERRAGRIDTGRVPNQATSTAVWEDRDAVWALITIAAIETSGFELSGGK